MANDMNSVMLIGRITRDAELKYTHTGTALCMFSIAVGKQIVRNNQREDEVSYIDCTVWDKLATALHPHLVKGKQISVGGSIKQQRWEQDGQNRSKIGVIVEKIQLLGDTRQTDHRMQASGIQSNHMQQAYPPGPESFDDDIPF
jgi:single-strand DNA-binding protein